MKTKTAEEYVASWDRGLAKALTGAVDQESLEESQCLVALFEQIFTAGAEAQLEACAVELERQVESGWYSTCPPGTAVRICPLVTLPKGEG